MDITLVYETRDLGSIPRRPTTSINTVMKYLILLLVFMFTSCAQTTFYKDGQRIACFQGNMTDMEYIQTKDLVMWRSAKVDHAAATKAQGTATSKTVASLGSAVAAGAVFK